MSLCQRILQRSPGETLSTTIDNEEAPPKRGPGRHQINGYSSRLDLSLSPAETVELALERGIIGPHPTRKPVSHYGELWLDAYYQTEIGRGIGMGILLCTRLRYAGFDYHGPVTLDFRDYALCPERCYCSRKRSQEHFAEADALTMRDWLEILTRSACEGVRHSFGGYAWGPPHMCSAVFRAAPSDFVRDFERIYRQHHEDYRVAVLLAQEEGPYTPNQRSWGEPYFGSLDPHRCAPEWPDEAEIAAFVEGLQPDRLAQLRAQAAAKGEAWLRDCLCAVGADHCHLLPGGGVLWAVLPGAALYRLYRDLYELLGEEPGLLRPKTHASNKLTARGACVQRQNQRHISV